MLIHSSSSCRCCHLGWAVSSPIEKYFFLVNSLPSVHYLSDIVTWGIGGQETSSDSDEANTDVRHGSSDAAGRKKKKKAEGGGRLLAAGPAPEPPSGASRGF